MKKLSKYLLIGSLVSGLVVLLYLSDTYFLRVVESKVYDSFFVLRGRVPVRSNRVVLVAVDERSLDEVGRWPWPRGRVADLIRSISARGAKVIGLDMGFFEPDDRLEMDHFRDWADRIERGEKPDPVDFLLNHHPDAVLAKTIASVEADVVLGFFFHTAEETLARIDPAEADKRRSDIAKFAIPAIRYSSPRAVNNGFLEALVPEQNQPLIFQASPYGGYLNILPDEDGVVRKIPLLLQCGREVYPALTLTTLARFLGRPLPVLQIGDNGLNNIRLGRLDIPVDGLGQVWINYRGPERVVQWLEASDVLQGRLPENALQGKAVIVGVTAAGLSDLDPTPFDSLHPGPDIHAQLLDNLLVGDHLLRPRWSTAYDLLAIIFLGMGAGLIVARMGLLGAVASFAGLGLGYLGLAYWLFLEGFIVRTVHPLLALTAGAGCALAYRYFTEVREKRWIKSAFQHYLNPNVIDQLMAKPGQLNTGGEKKVLTAAFADIRGFTTISEELDPAVLSTKLNFFLDRLTEVILESGGVLDKFMGDALMFFFGAPLDNPRHAQDACRTALGMLATQEELNRVWTDDGLPEFRLGFGLNTGPMVVGNMGSRHRFDYTILGDSVNLASRLEGLTKAYPGVDIIVGPETEAAAREEFHFRKLDLIPVRGRKRLVEIFQLLGEKKEGVEPPLVRWWAEAYQAYLDRDWDGALKTVEAILEDQPGDGPSLILRDRCLRYRQFPPPPDWEGRLLESPEQGSRFPENSGERWTDAVVNEKLSLVLGFSEDLTANQDPDLLFQLIMDRISKVLEADRSSLFIVDRDRNEIWTKVAQNSGRIVVALGRGIAGRVARTGETVRVEEARSLDYFDPTWDAKLNYFTKSVLCLPVKDGGGRIVGVLQVLNKLNGSGFRKEDEDLLRIMGKIVSLALVEGQI